MLNLQAKAVLSTILASTQNRLLHLTRYPALLLSEMLIPVVHVVMPILLGRAIAGQQAAANFAVNTGTENYIPYLLLGSIAFIVITRAFWDLAYWLRFEQETGTLEGLYLTPCSRLAIATGVALYSAARSLVTGVLAFLVGCAVFRLNPFHGDILLAFGFLLVGQLSVYAMAFLFVAFLLRIKESSQLLGVLQWGISFFAGVYFPVLAFPRILRFIALLLPPTWMINSLRAAILGTAYFFQAWYLDMAALWVLLLLLLMISAGVFRRIETTMRKNDGFGGY